MLGPRLALAALVALLAGLGLAPAGAQAANAPITVGLLSDQPDFDSTDGVCEIADPKDPPRGCTLRAAIQEANGRAGKDIIGFALPGTAPTIAPVTPLPAFRDSVVVDGFTQPGASVGDPRVELDGGNLPDTDDGKERPTFELVKPYGLEVGRGADHSAVRGLIVHSFPNVLLGADGVRDVTFEGNWVGIGQDGTTEGTHAARNGIGLEATRAVVVGATADGMRNVVAGSFDAQIIIGGGAGTESRENIVTENYVGLTPDGLYPLPSPRAVGIVATAASTGTTTLDEIADNVVTGQRIGIAVGRATDAWVRGNVSGLGPDGHTTDPEADDEADPDAGSFGNSTGLALADGATDTQVGGADEAAGNTLTNNTVGLSLRGAVTDAVIRNNRIGTHTDGKGTEDPDGLPLANDVGIRMNGVGSQVPVGTQIGGDTREEGNVIGNSDTGLGISDGVSETAVVNNSFGVSRDSRMALPNAYGVRVLGGAPVDHLAIGEPGHGNQIVNSEQFGVELRDTLLATVQGNRIGVTWDGKRAANHYGVVTEGDKTVIGGAQSGAGNLISGNDADGLSIVNAATDVSVVGNKIGTDPSGGIDEDRFGLFRNGGSGIVLDNVDGEVGPRNTRIGATFAPLAGNTVANNGEDGIAVRGAATGTTIVNNDVGRWTADARYGNDGAGVYVSADGTAIGAVGPDARNYIGGNRWGVYVEGAVGTSVEGNAIGRSAGEGTAVPGNTQAGVLVADDASDTLIGAAADADVTDPGECPAGKACNTIQDNGGPGVHVQASAGTGTTVRGNAMTDNAGLDIDVGYSGPSRSVLLDPARYGEEGVVNPPSALRVEAVNTARNRVSGIVPPMLAGDAPEDAKVDVYASGRDPVGNRGRLRTLVGTVRPDAGGRFDLEVEGFHASYSATTTWADGSTSEPSVACTATVETTSDADPDYDGDGLCDSWETEGLDYDGDGYPEELLQGASPEALDVFLEIDEMRGLDVPDGTWRRVATALADGPDGGIAAHFAGGDSYWVNERVPESDGPLVVDGRGSGQRDDAGDYRYGSRTGGAVPCEGQLGRADERTGPDCYARWAAQSEVRRYGLVADRLDGGAAGAADPARRSFVVAAGAQFSSFENVDALTGGSVCGTYDSCRADVIAGSVLHELGKTFGLRTGGGDDVAFKPNYLSVMNPSFRWANRLPDRPLDYSRKDLKTLDEADLDETQPILGPYPSLPADVRERWWGTVHAAYDGEAKRCEATIVALGEPTWDAAGDGGDPSPHAKAGLHRLGRNGLSGGACRDLDQLQALEGHDDWLFLETAFPDVPGWEDGVFAGGGSRRAAAADAAQPSVQDELDAAATTDADGDGVPNATDNCGTVRNAGQQDGDGDGIGDACVHLIRERDVAVSVSGSHNVPRDGARELTVRVANAYPVAADGVQVAVALPTGVTALAGAPSQGTLANGTWNVGSVPARGAATLTVTLSGTADTPLGDAGALRAEVVAANQPDWDSTPGNGAAEEDDLARHAVSVIESEPTIVATDVRVRERDRGDRDAVVAVRVDGPVDGRPSVAWTTEEGSATAGSDFRARSGRAELDGGAAELRIPVRGDTIDEADEAFRVRLSDPDGAVLDTAAVTVTILDDDDPARAGDLRYLTCLSGDNGVAGSCPSTDVRLDDPTDLTAAPDGKHLYVADGARVVTLERDARTTALRATGCVAYAPTTGCTTLPGAAGRFDSVAVSPDGRFVYAAGDAGSEGRLTILTRDGATGALTAAGVAASAPTAGKVVLSPDGAHAYVFSGYGDGGGFGRTRVFTYGRLASGALTAPTCQVEGALAQDDCAALDVRLEGLMDFAWAPDGTSLYSRSVDGFAPMTRNPATGTLSAGPCVTGPDGCVQLVACTSDSGTDQCPPPPIDAIAGGGGVAVSPDGATVTITSDAYRTLWQFRRGTGGDLTAAGCLQERGLPASLQRPCTATDAPVGAIGGLANGADGAHLYGATAGGGVLPLRRTTGGVGLEPQQCTDPGLEDGYACDADEAGGRGSAQQVADLVVPAGGESVHSLLGLRQVGNRAVRGVASYLRVRGTGVQEPPVCADSSVTTKPGQRLELRLRCADAAGQRLTLAVVDGPAHGTLGALEGDAVDYTPAAGFRGADAVRFRATADDGRESTVATARVTVQDPPPVCEAVAASAEPGKSVLVDLRCTDPENDAVTIAIASAPSRGSAELVGATRARYSAPAGGGDTAFTYVGTDAGGNASAPATVTVTVPVPPPPAPPAPPNPPTPPGGSTGTGGSSSGCGSRGCSSGGSTVGWTYYCDGRRVGSTGTCKGQVTICPPNGICSSPERPGGGHALATIAKAKAPFKGAIGRKRFSVAAGERARMTIKLTARGRKVLRKRKRLKVKMVSVVTQPDGTVQRTSQVVTIRLKAPRKRGR